MAISLSKGGNVSLSKEAPGLTEVIVGLGWDPRSTDGTDFDLDASIFVTGENGKRSGEGKGDDEQVNVKLSSLAPAVKKLVFAVTIHEADGRKQNFGQVSNAYIRVLNKADGKELARYDLSEDASTETAMIFGELYRHGEEFKFKAIGQGFTGGLKPLAEAHGVSIG
jgi:tellurium resistance protein TerD